MFHHLVNIPSIPIDHFYKHMVSSNGSITQFISTDESINDTAAIWTVFSYTCIYGMAIGLLIHAGLGIFCCYFFWYQPARLECQPLQSSSMQHTIVDNDVDVLPIHICNSKAGQPIIRPCKNHDLCMEQEPT